MGEEIIASETDFSNGLIDVTELSLAELDKIGDSSLDIALRRILDDDDTGPVAGFSSRI